MMTDQQKGVASCILPACKLLVLAHLDTKMASYIGHARRGGGRGGGGIKLPVSSLLVGLGFLDDCCCGVPCHMDV